MIWLLGDIALVRAGTLEEARALALPMGLGDAAVIPVYPSGPAAVLWRRPEKVSAAETRTELVPRRRVPRYPDESSATED